MRFLPAHPDSFKQPDGGMVAGVRDGEHALDGSARKDQTDRFTDCCSCKPPPLRRPREREADLGMVRVCDLPPPCHASVKVAQSVKGD